MGYYNLKTASNGQTYFNLHASNGEIILTSEMYTSKGGAKKGIESCQTNSPKDGQYDRLDSVKGEPYFVLKATNHEVIGRSEMYSSKAARDNGIASCKKNGPTTDIRDNT